MMLYNVMKAQTLWSRKFMPLCATNRLQYGRFRSRMISSKATRNVLISTSNVIYHNLALEEWLYENEDLSCTEFLLMWKNRPVVVSGRHQNPWLEANIPLITSRGFDIARRSSGGGTVYHDEGNLNLSFLMSRDNYNRRKNLDLVVEAVTSKWDIDLYVNDRDDILLNKLYKVSGTAAKLGRLQSYHHFTLLHSVCQDLLQQCLQSPMQGATSKATKSFPSAVMNLSDQEPSINFESLTEVIGREFLNGGGPKASTQTFQYVDPLCEKQFPGVSEISNRLQTWDWKFGKTPEFSIKRTFSGQTFNSKPFTLNMKLTIKRGMLDVSEITIDVLELKLLEKGVNMFFQENCNFPLTKGDLSNFKTNFENNFCVIGDYQKEAVWILRSFESCLDFL